MYAIPRRLLRACLLLLAASAALLAREAAAQQTRIDHNFSFELPSMGTPVRPWGWGYAWGRAGLVRDSLHAYDGRWSLRSLPSPDARNAFSMWVRVDPSRDTRVRVSGWIRTESLTDGDAGFGVMYSAPVGAVTDTLPPQRVTGTTGWVEVAYETVVPAGITWIQPIGHVRGSGTAWFDDVQILIDGEPLPDWTLPPPPSTAEIDALRPHVIPFTGIDAGSGFADLQALRSWIGDARIVALGEANHGSSVFFRAKHRLLEFAVRELGFTHFAIEDNAAAVRMVNEYVRTGRGDLDSLMQPLFTVWRTREVRDLIEWMRAHNATGHAPIEFVGIDMQDPVLPTDSVLAFLGRHDPAYLPAAARLYNDMLTAWRAARYPQRSPDIYDAWVAAARAVHEHMSQKRGLYLQRADSGEVAWAIQSADLALQSAAMMRSATPVVRDSSMAANLEWHLAGRPGARAILWAHNGHISYKPGITGGYLRAAYGERYRAMALTAYEGEYRARDIVTGQWGTARHFPALPGTVEHALNSLGLPYFILDVRSTGSTPLLRWLIEPRPFRNTGTQGVDYDFAGASTVAIHYDAILFVKIDTPAVPLPPPGTALPGS